MHFTDKQTTPYSSEGEKRKFLARNLKLYYLVDNPNSRKYIENNIKCLQDSNAIVSVCPDCGAVSVHPIRCNHRFFCPECARRIERRYLGKYSHVIRETEKPGTNLFFLTVTLKNPAVLTREYLRTVKECFYKLRRSPSSPLHGAGIAKMECPPGRAGTWNLHIHVVFSSLRSDPNGLEREISAKWRKLTKKYLPEESFIVRCKPATKHYLIELLKYVMKLRDSANILEHPEKFSEFLTSFMGVRILWTWGDFNGLKVDYQYVCPECGVIPRFMSLKESFKFMQMNAPPAPLKYFI